MPRSPQRLAPLITSSLLGSLQGDPGLRLIGTTGRRIFGGGALMPQRFVRPPQPNDADTIARASTQINTRLSLNRARGRL
ncbi:MAG TPA: hypothetical protein VMY78_09915 [Solirubrobacteraceae bacterium]|nr:hypothetical protein [Solirubrobacteraceae bacterium]